MRSIGTLVSVSLAAFALLTAPVAAELEEETLDSRDLTESDKQFVSETGSQVVAQIASARRHIQTNNLQEARGEVGRARTMLGQVRDRSASNRVQDRIESALKSLMSTGEAKPETLLPIYAEIDATEQSDAFAVTLKLVDAAKGHLESGDTEAATSALVDASSSILYHEIDLPIESTYSALTRAQLALIRRNPQAADQYLREAEAGIQQFTEIASSSSETELPAVGAGPEE